MFQSFNQVRFDAEYKASQYQREARVHKHVRAARAKTFRTFSHAVWQRVARWAQAQANACLKEHTA